jgi:hypothetical protein
VLAVQHRDKAGASNHDYLVKVRKMAKNAPYQALLPDGFKRLVAPKPPAPSPGKNNSS